MSKFTRELFCRPSATMALLSVCLMARAGLVAQYFPMNGGDSRYYEDYNIPSYKSTEVFTATSYNGQSLFSLNFHDEWNTTSTSTGVWYLGYSGNSLALYGILTSWGSLSFNSPANILTDQILTNDGTITTSINGVLLGSYTVSVTVKATVISVGSITAPAGTFSNCKLLEVVESVSGLSSYDSAAWVLAPGVGIIGDSVAAWDPYTSQFTLNSDDFELVSYTITRPPTPILQPITAKNGTVQLTWSTVLNHVYQVQYATNLVSPNWLNLGNNITATGSSLSSTDAIGSNKLRFYRVFLVQ